MAWSIVADAVGDNPGRSTEEPPPGEEPVPGTNEGGIVVYVVNEGGTKQEVGRVAFVRRNSKNPRVSFERQIEKLVERARSAVGILNTDLMGDGELE